MPLDPRRARQSHTAGQARRRTKFCPFVSISPWCHIATKLMWQKKEVSVPDTPFFIQSALDLEEK